MIAPDTLLQNRYLVKEQIGQGGMGAVYLATDQRFGSTVALKETFFDDANLRKAFEREARLLNHLRHPALPRVSDHFVEDDGQFLVMEFIPGDDLAQMLKEKGIPFGLSEVLDWADQLLDALEYLHTHEPPIIHRDIKPQNLKLTPRGHVVLLDFGLAKGTPLQASRVTATGSLLGYSFHYAPLEQMQGTGTDPRSDLYSLGATLYHLLTGSPPPDALTRATAVLNGEPDPLRPASEMHTQVPASVAQALVKAMAQSAAQRPQTAEAMRKALREAGKQSSSAGSSAVVQQVSGAGLDEQDTQLIDAPTKVAVTDAATSVKVAGTAAGLHEAPTVIQNTSSNGKPSPAATRPRDGDSVATKISPALARASRRRLSGRLLAAILSVALLAVVAAAVYKFKHKPTTQTPNIQPLTVAPGDSATPEPAASPIVEAENPIPSPEPPVAREPAQQASSANKQPKRKASSPANPRPEQNGERDNPPPVPDEPDLRDSGLSPEERARIIEDVRRAKQQAREAERQRNGTLREQRQRRERELQRTRDRRRGAPPQPPPF